MTDFSVLMSIYGGDDSKYLADALNSISEKQSLKPSQYVIVIDGPISSDLESVLQDFLDRNKRKSKVVRLTKNVGLGRALQKGLEKVDNEIVVRMDSDDVSLPYRFERLIEPFFKDPSLVLCGSSIIEYDEKMEVKLGERKVPLKYYDIKKFSRHRSPFNHVSVAFKKSKVMHVGGYEHFPLMEDYYLWLKLLSSYDNLINIEEPLVLVRAGKNMLARRRGIEYIKSEYRLLKYFLKNKDYNNTQQIFIFFARVVTRTLSGRLLNSIYGLLRK